MNGRDPFLVTWHERPPSVKNIRVDAEYTKPGTRGHDILHHDVFDKAAAAPVGLYIKKIERLSLRVEAAVMHIDIADSAREFAAYGDELVTPDDPAVADGDVF